MSGKIKVEYITNLNEKGYIKFKDNSSLDMSNAGKGFILPGGNGLPEQESPIGGLRLDFDTNKLSVCDELVWRTTEPISLTVNESVGFGTGIYVGYTYDEKTFYFTRATSIPNAFEKLNSKLVYRVKRVCDYLSTFTVSNVPAGTTFHVWGAAGAGRTDTGPYGGAGGYSTGITKFFLNQITCILGEGGFYATDQFGVSRTNTHFTFGGGGSANCSDPFRGGGFSGVFNGSVNYSNYTTLSGSNPFGGTDTSDTVDSKSIIIAGGGGAASFNIDGTGRNGGNGGGKIANSGIGGTVTRLRLVEGGTGYASTDPPYIVFSGGGGVGAAATLTLSGGVVDSVTITNGGAKYTSEPTVIFECGPAGSGGEGAVAEAGITSSMGGGQSSGSNRYTSNVGTGSCTYKVSGGGGGYWGGYSINISGLGTYHSAGGGSGYVSEVFLSEAYTLTSSTAGTPPENSSSYFLNYGVPVGTSVFDSTNNPNNLGGDGLIVLVLP